MAISSRTGFCDAQELAALGLSACGQNVLVSRRASLYRPELIALDDSVRIDDFCVLSAGSQGISVGRNVHLAVYCSLIGAGRIEIDAFANLSSRVSVYSSNDDYSGHHMTNPTVPAEFTAVRSAPVRIGRHVIIGSGSVVLPGVVLGEGAGVGALSLVRENCQPFGMYAGVPARRVGERSRDLLELERRFLSKASAPS